MIDLTPSQALQPASKRTLLIDGDSIAYVVGWNHRDDADTFAGESAVDDIVHTLLSNMSAIAYLGVIRPDKGKCFREEVYKVKPYKGNRSGETEDWISKWKPIVEERLLSRWKFVRAPHHLETDDVIVAAANYFGTTALVNHPSGQIATEVWICSPDKDLKQCPGNHFDFKTGQAVQVDNRLSQFNLYYQLLIGDTTDNIAGVPKCGPKKAKELLESADFMFWDSAVRGAYDDYYGSYYGPIIFAENQAVIQMMDKSHPLWEKYGFNVQQYIYSIVALT